MLDVLVSVVAPITFGAVKEVSLDSIMTVSSLLVTTTGLSLMAYCVYAITHTEKIKTTQSYKKVEEKYIPVRQNTQQNDFLITDLYKKEQKEKEINE